MGSAAGTLTAPVVANALKSAGVDGVLADSLTALASTAAGATVGGTAGGTTAMNEVTNNYLSHKQLSVVEGLLDNCKGDPECRKGVIAQASAKSQLQDAQMQFACTLAPASEACTTQMTQAIGYKEDYSTVESLGLEKDWVRSAQSLNSYVNTAQGAPFRQYVFEGNGLQSVYLSPVENYVATIGDFTGSTYTAIQTNGIWSKETALALGLGLAELASVKVRAAMNMASTNEGFGKGGKPAYNASGERSSSIDVDANKSSIGLSYEAAPYHGKVDNAVKSRAPTNGQDALESSVQVKETSPRRVGIDYDSSEFVVFDNTIGTTYHGHVRSWADLHPDMQRALQKAGMADRKGNIIKPDNNK